MVDFDQKKKKETGFGVVKKKYNIVNKLHTQNFIFKCVTFSADDRFMGK